MPEAAVNTANIIIFPETGDLHYCTKFKQNIYMCMKVFVACCKSTAAALLCLRFGSKEYP